MAGVSAGLEDAHQEGRQGNLDRDSAIPGWTNGRRADRWNTATGLARRLQSRGVPAGQLYKLLDALLSKDWNSDAGFERSNQEAERLVAEQIFVGHAPCTRLVMDRVTQAEGRPADMRRLAATPTICQHGCSRQENLPNGSCCQTYPRSHTVQHHESQQGSGDAHFIRVGSPSNVPGAQESAITRGSLDQRPAALDPRRSQSRQECTSKDREARAWAKSGPYSRGRNHCSSTAAGERQAEETEAGPVCRLCGQEPAASDLGYPECWECFFGMHR